MGVLVLVFLAVLAIVAGLARGPLPLAFVAPYIEQAVETQYPGLDVNFTGLELEWNRRDKNLVVGISDLVVSDNKRRLASIPDVTVVFSGGALLRGRIAPAALEFTGLAIRLNRNRQGEIKLGYDYALMNENPSGDEAATTANDTAEDASSRETLLGILQELSNEPDKTTITGYLQRLELYNSSVYIEDEILGRFWRVTDADLFVWREANGLRGQANGNLKVGSETVSVVALADYDRTFRRTEIDGQFTDLPLPLVGEQAAELDILKGIGLTLSGQVNLTLDEHFIFDSVGFDVTAGEGKIDLPELYKQPLPIESVAVSGKASGDFRHIDLEQVEARTLGATVRMSGSVDLAEAGIGLAIDGGVNNLKVNDLGRFWPYSMAVNGYNWVTANIRDGVVPAGAFTIKLPAGVLASGDLPKDAVKLSFDLEGTSANYYAPLPKVTDIKGHGVLTATGVTISGLTGKLGNLAVTSDKVVINEFDKYDQLADIRIHVTGPSRDIFTFLDLKPLGLATPYGIVPASMTGEGAVDASFKFPLRFDLKLKNVDYSASGDFTGASIPDVAEGIDLKDGKLKVAVNPKGVTVNGTAALNTVPVSLMAESWFSGAREGHRLYRVRGDVDDAGRAALKLGTPYLEGPMAADLQFETEPKGSASGTLKLDLEKTKITVSALHWVKEAGTPGRFSTDIKVAADDVATLSNITLTAGDLSATGTAELNGELLTRLDVPSIVYGDNDFGFEFTQKTKDNMNLHVHGAEFDLRPFVVATYDLNEADIDGPENDRNIDIDVDLAKILLDQDIVLETVSAKLRVEGNLIENGTAKGHFAGGKKVDFDLARKGEGRTVTFISDDAGSLFRGLDLYDDFRDGTLKLAATIDDTKESRPAKGTIDIKNVRVVNAPVLGRILTLGSLGGIVDLLRGEGMVFATVEGPFTYENGVFTTRDFRAIGSIGITVNGTVDQPANKIDMYGTVIPSYTLNSMLGNIPILGTLLVGKQGEGIFGFSYKVSGGLDDPQTSVNAVSALAPGILRRMFFEPWDQEDVQPPTTTKPDSRPSP
ncbi:MAG: AsmA-like C-terminal domain-containing protein [Sneathiella sp.]|nr:AsmA-like C-terminal domain-containing protein [Sneathiella sp.]